MELKVRNHSANGGGKQIQPAPAHQGTGLGLANVTERLQAHFGNRADCRFGPVPGGYEVSLAIPVDDDD
jgi:sensor histidine kinase YesM